MVMLMFLQKWHWKLGCDIMLQVSLTLELLLIPAVCGILLKWKSLLLEPFKTSQIWFYIQLVGFLVRACKVFYVTVTQIRLGAGFAIFVSKLTTGQF